MPPRQRSQSPSRPRRLRRRARGFRRTAAETATPTTAAAPTMAMATSRSRNATTRRAMWPAALGVLALVAGCGGASSTQRSSAGRPPSAFAWLKPAAAPAGWKQTRLSASGVTFAYPPGWHAIHTDPGTATVALTDSRHTIVGYLNATPHQGAETLANWAGFRTGHIRDEGSRQVRTVATATGLRFRSGRGSCIA